MLQKKKKTHDSVMQRLCHILIGFTISLNVYCSFTLTPQNQKAPSLKSSELYSPKTIRLTFFLHLSKLYLAVGRYEVVGP
jgi:hypothetical protein